MDTNPEEVLAARRREATAVRQGSMFNRAERLSYTMRECGGGKCTPMHYSRTTEGEGGAATWDYAQAAQDYRKALVRGGWLEE